MGYLTSGRYRFESRGLGAGSHPEGLVDMGRYAQQRQAGRLLAPSGCRCQHSCRFHRWSGLSYLTGAAALWGIVLFGRCSNFQSGVAAMNAKAVKPRNATGSVKVRIEELNADFTSLAVSFSLQPLPKIQGYDFEGDPQIVVIGTSGVTGPGTYSVSPHWGTSVAMSFILTALGGTEITRDGTIVFEVYELGKKAKGTFDVTLLSSGLRAQGSFDVVND